MSCACTLSPSASFELSWYPGDTASIQVAVVRSNGEPYPLADTSLRFLVAATDQPGAEVLWDLGPEDASTAILDADAGLALITPGEERSLALAPHRTYPALAILTTADGQRLTLKPGYLVTPALIPAPADES